MSILSPILMTTDIQKAYMRGYAKGRAFQKKNKDPLLSVTHGMPKDFGMIRDYEEVRDSGLFSKKVIAFLRNGLSL